MNRLTPGSNMLWHTKFILPEHQAAMLNQSIEWERKSRPVIGIDELEEISRNITQSLYDGSDIKLIVFGDYMDRELQGKVIGVNQVFKQLKLEVGDTFEWVQFKDIIKANMV